MLLEERVRTMGERFYCPRCGYGRPLKPGEDGFRIYLIHEERCNPPYGRQLLLPCITEDDLDFIPVDPRRSLMPVFRVGQRMGPDEPRRFPAQPAADSRKAA